MLLSFANNNVGIKIADALGLLKGRYAKDSQAIMDAFCRAAEDDIGKAT